ncbi:MAG: hypothetical protein HOK53_07090 [Gammaproteobacteria bacterium]|nr:hypothetical protein [Gammaproteobacteria bacterium]
MSKPFLIIQLRPEDATADNELSGYAGIIVGGSPFDISTPADQKSATQLEIEAGFSDLFDTVIAQDFPFLECCSGNGLLGNYLGASISQKYAEAVGGATVALSEEGKRDPLLKGFPDTFRVLLGHK